MLDIMDTYNHNNIPHRYDKYTNQKDNSKYTKKVIMRKNCFFALNKQKCSNYLLFTKKKLYESLFL